MLGDSFVFMVKLFNCLFEGLFCVLIVSFVFGCLFVFSLCVVGCLFGW